MTGEELEYEPDEVVTIGLYCLEGNAQSFNMDDQIRQIESLREKITAAAIKANKKPPKFILSVLLVPDWTRTNNSYNDALYLQNHSKFFEKFKQKIDTCHCKFELKDAYKDASLDEKHYLERLKNRGANADWIKTHAIISNSGIKHLQLDSNTQVYDYDSFYAHTFGQSNNDALNASAYDTNSAYVSPHNKVVYTVPNSKIVPELTKLFLQYCHEHQNLDDLEKDCNAIYSKAFTPALAKVGLVISKKVFDAKENIEKIRYLVNFNNPEYRLTLDIITAVNMSWATSSEPDPYDALKKLPALTYRNAELTFPCFINIVNVHTSLFLWHDDRQSLDQFRNHLHDRENDMAIIKAYYEYIKKYNPDFLIQLVASIPHTQLGEKLCQDAFQCDIKTLHQLVELKKFESFLNVMHKNGLGKNPNNMSEEEQIKLATILSLQEGSQGFKLEDNRFTRALRLSCQNVEGDGFCLFRAIARQVIDRNLNARRHPPMIQLPTTMEAVLERVAEYFSNNSQTLMDRIFPPPNREAFGTGERSQELFQVALREYNDPSARQQRLEGFRDNFYEYINLGNYNAGGQLVNAADWLPQIMSDILHVDIDIYDGQRPGGGFRTNNGHGERIGLGRVNNNHYVSLDGDLNIAWLAEQEAMLQSSMEQQSFDLLKGYTISSQFTQYFHQKMGLEKRLFETPEFLLRQLVEARNIGAYLMSKMNEPTKRETFKLLNKVKDEVRQEVLKALKPEELEKLWQGVENLDGYQNLKSDLWKIRGKSMDLVLRKNTK